MECATIDPIPPDLPGLTWRPISRDHLAALNELANNCSRTDGSLSFINEPEHLLDRFFPDAPKTAIGAFASGGGLSACAAVHLADDAGTWRATISGLVRPELRRKGLGSYLMVWSQAQARSLLTAAAASQGVLRIRTEGLTEPADKLYRAHGFTNVFEELVMHLDLRLALPDHALPAGVTIANWQSDLAERFFEVYEAAFRDRPGFPGWSAAEWISRVTEDDLIPEWTLLASVDGVPSGFVIGTIVLSSDPPGSYINQIGVIPAQRRRGLASGLIVETLRRIQAADHPWCQLVVNVNNPGAIQAYARLGFVTIGRRARYERMAQSDAPGSASAGDGSAV